MAGFNVDTIRSTLSLSGGFATTEKYSVVFSNLPSQLDQGVNASFQYLCENVAIPTKSISASDKFIYGTNYQMPYRQTFAESSMSFYCTRDMAEKKFFDKWQNLIVDPISGDLKFHENYTCTVTITQFNKQQTIGENGVYRIELLNAWPSIVAEVQYGHSQGSEIAKLPVTFQYEKWIPKHGTQSAGVVVP
tara:strand:+ start:291 stop:863 length:573 start_codon:yes stop_codon:yes gene_type:complete